MSSEYKYWETIEYIHGYRHGERDLLLYLQEMIPKIKKQKYIKALIDLILEKGLKEVDKHNMILVAKPKKNEPLIKLTDKQQLI